jgi:hypothetical protein
VHVEPKTV